MKGTIHYIILNGIIFLYLIILWNLKAHPTESFEIDSIESNYLHYKALGKYKRAMKIIEEWIIMLNDPITIETNIFRIKELIKYPELIEKGIISYNRILNSNKTVKQNTYLQSRINIFLNQLLLMKGRIDEAVSIRDTLKFINQFKIIGPFRNNGSHDFERQHPVEIDFRESVDYIGKEHRVKWFDIEIDLTGKIDLNDIFEDVNDSLFYLYKEIDIIKSGIYEFSLGKTGYTDIWIDGIKIFSNRKRHRFNFDQYLLKIYLQKGKHKFLIKTGDSNSVGTIISVRFKDKTEEKYKSESNNKIQKNEYACFLKSSYFYSLDDILNRDFKNEYLSFLIAYLFHISGLNSYEYRESLKYFNLAKKNKIISSVSNYYLGIIENDINKKDYYFYESLKDNKNNIESLEGIAELKLDYYFIYDASPIIESIKSIDPQSIIYIILKAKALISLNWHYEALKLVPKLKRSDYKSLGYQIEAKIKKLQKRYRDAAHCYRHLHKENRYNKIAIDDLIECYEKLGRYEDLVRLLLRSSKLFHNNIWIRLKLADTIKNIYTPRASLPYLTSAMKLSPYNKSVLFDIGITYHRIDKLDLARYYLTLALMYDPNNFSLKRYLRIINNEKNMIEKYLVKEDPLLLAQKSDKYSDEAAIVLLKETAIKVLPDGSYEKWIHKIFKINDSDITKKFSTQYIVIDPSTDRIENLRCFVINDGNSVESTISYKRSLSDPESRLYYNLEANVISLPSIKNGSIIDLSYIIKSKEGKIYKNYFGARIIVGSKFRTIYTNILISFPEKKCIFYHLKGIKKDKIKLITNQKRKIYKLFLENIPPYKEEVAMPHPSDILPCVYFTSHISWDNLFRWYMPLLRDSIRTNDEMKKSLNKIIKLDDNDLDKVKKIYNHINKEIRYVGFEFGIGGIKPRSADLTYHTKMGDCKDITVLLIAMLKEAGIKAKMALIRTRENGEANLSVPYLGEFNHAICYVAINNGFFIDGTAKMSGYKELPSDDRGRVALVLDEKNYSFIKIKNNFIDENLEIASTNVNIYDSGNAKLTRTIFIQGSSASRARFEMKDIDNKIQKISEYWNKYFPGAMVDNLEIESININKPVSYNYQINIPLLFNTGENEIIFNAFLISSNFYKNFCMLKKRIFPLILFDTWTMKVNIKYNIPKGYKVLLVPKSEEFKHKKFKAKFKTQNTDNTIDVYSIIHIKGNRIEVDEYKSFRDFSRFIEKKENQRIILIKDK